MVIYEKPRISKTLEGLKVEKMNKREQIVQRLSDVTLGGGSHESLSAIAKAIYEPAGGWTIGACEALRQTLVRLLGGDTAQGDWLSENTHTPPSDGNRITDELRGFAEDPLLGYASQETHKEIIIAIADRIDAAHQKAIASVMNDALYHANDKDMADLGWVRLPKDADNEPIHMGDLVTVPWKDKVYEVAGFSCSKQLCGGIRTIWIDVYSPEKQRNMPLCGADSCRHYHAPTVEDVLREFFSRYVTTKPKEEDDAIIAEFAAKLRLAEESAS